jgi:hypothetical protein
MTKNNAKTRAAAPIITRLLSLVSRMSSPATEKSISES